MSGAEYLIDAAGTVDNLERTCNCTHCPELRGGLDRAKRPHKYTPNISFAQVHTHMPQAHLLIGLHIALGKAAWDGQGDKARDRKSG